jgi:hypothetical protein
VACLGAVLAQGCGGIAVIDGEPGEGGGGSSSSTSNGGSSGTSSGGSVQSISLVRALAYADCTLNGGGAGELGVDFTMSFENVGSTPATVEIVKAHLQGMIGRTSFSVSPASVTVAAMSTPQFELSKTGPAVGTLPCDWCSPTDTELEVELLVDGVPRTFTDSISSVSCTF